MHLLVVEDDQRLRRLLKRLLEEDRHVVEAVADGTTAVEIATGTSGIEAVILDVGLPDISGLDAGADDYLVKPFAFEELSARLRALSRRGSAGARRAEPRLVAGAIELDEAARRVTVGGDPIDLSPREFSLLECLLRHVGQTLSRDQLLDQAWPFSVAVTPNAVDAYVDR